MVENGNFIHVKVERGEALESKRDVLASQIALLRILKRINSYRAYRSKELELKIEFYKKIRELKTKLVNLEKALPKLKTLKKFGNEEKQRKAQPKKTEIRDLSIEGQLQEIQRKLEELQRR